MASASMSMPPPPSMGGTPGQPPAPTSTPGASPAPPTPSPSMQQGTQLLIGAVSNLRAIAKAFPAAASKVAEANNLLREISALMMQSQNPGEPQAPPTGG